MAEQTRSHLRLADLANRKPTTFDLVPDTKQRARIAEELGILGIKKLRFTGEIAPTGKQDWTLTAHLGATVSQSCVVTLDPVTTRIDEDVTRNYTADYVEMSGTEIEMPEDDTIEPLPETIDLAVVMSEALALALPAFPRAEGASVGQVVHTEPGKEPMTDDDAKPFAGLGALRDALQKKDPEDGS
ncbi:YceD family protein [Cognatiyoonia koreensis]|uniref:YceD family protein n=1 Tax=Cognatiyoonia koreensis TaxID=364200 RepID=UPI001F61D1C5|nr:DUF177 domain-containing protein [Cognatiyoonia koreensis]